MMSAQLAFQNAQWQVDRYVEASEIMAKHREAMERTDCDDFLLMGIQAFDWLIRADLESRKAMFLGQGDYDARMSDFFETRFKSWLVPCDLAEQWAALQIERGHSLDNLAEFQKRCKECRAIVNSFTDNQLSKGVAILRDIALREHHDGQTAGFLEEV